jgi:S1-C subfamily serine protease
VSVSYYPKNEILIPKWHSPDGGTKSRNRGVWIALPMLALVLVAIGFWFLGFYWPERNAKKATVLVWVDTDGDGRPERQGSGVIINPRGYVLTNRHVVCGESNVKPAKIQIWYKPGSQEREIITATLLPGPDGPLGSSGDVIRNDWAVLQVAYRESLPYVRLAEKTDFQEEEGLAALGFPRADETSTNAYGPSVKVVRGEITRVDRSAQRGVIRLTHSAATAEGMSGGPVVQRGRLIGLNTAGLTGGKLNPNENYALPAYLLRESVFKTYGAN